MRFTPSGEAIAPKKRHSVVNTSVPLASSKREEEDALLEAEPGFKLGRTGAIFWIGKQVALRTFSSHEWVNPATTGAVRVSRSGGNAGRVQSICDPFNRTSVYTGNVPYSYFTIDLQEYSIIPTHYALRHGYNAGQVCAAGGRACGYGALCVQ